MSVRSAQSVTASFVTSDPTTRAAVDADSLPVGTLYLNGASDGASVVVTNLSTGLYSAAVTLPTLATGDAVEIVVSPTVASIAEKFVIWRDTADIAVTAAGGVTMGDGVTHGGTTAVLRLKQINATNPDGAGAIFKSTNASSFGLWCSGSVAGAQFDNAGFETNNGNLVQFGSTSSGAILAYGGDGPAILMNSDSTDGISITVDTEGHGISVFAKGTGKKALLLSGDAATDALAIAAGAGSPIDVFNADGSVNAALVETGLDAIATTAPTGPATTFREMMVQVWRRYFKKSAKAVSGLTVKTYADDGTTVVTTQDFTDDGAGNETLGGAS